MTIRNLDGFFSPRSIAVVGSDRHHPAVAETLLARLAATSGSPIHLVDIDPAVPAAASDRFRRAARFSDLAEGTADLVVHLGAPEQAPALIAAAGAIGTRAVVLAAPGFDAWPTALVTDCLIASRPQAVRLIGPGSLGVAAPGNGVDALLSAAAPAAGDLALIARSSAVLNATLAWAASHNVGFSGVVSLGQRTDVDVGDLIDHFAGDFRTRAILVHLEGVSSPRKFLSAARAAARSKPVVLIRSGRSRDRTGTTRTHAGRMTTADAVYEAALRRAGILRVEDLDEMFEAVETLTRLRIPHCRRLAVVSNGRSLATLATDRLADLGGELARLSEETVERLAPLARSQSAPGNPLTLGETDGPETMTQAIEALLADGATDGLLVLAAPTAFTPAEDIARTIAAAAEADRKRTGRRKAIIAGLVGLDPLPRAALDAARVPVHASPAEAVRSFMHLVRSAGAQEMLMAAPPSLPEDFTPDADAARAIVEAALGAGRTTLDPEETARVLAAYDIPVTPTRLVADAAAAEAASAAFFADHRHCVVKAYSPALPFKSDIDGVRLGLASPQEVRAAAEDLTARIGATHPDRPLAGLTVQPMLEDPHGVELYLGLADNPVFGPVVVFGHGGTAVEVTADIALELPPLDLHLAGALIERTRIARLLGAFRGRPAKDRAGVALALVKLSQIAIDIPEILELDINPLVATDSGLVALDARVVLGVPKLHPGRSGTSRLAIAPYPKEWEQTLTLKDGWKVFVRPVRPEDEALFKTFFEAVSPQDLRLRFFAPVKDFSHKFLSRLTQLDYARAMAFAAIEPASGAMLGAVRLHADPDHKTGEYAVMVRSDLKGRGLGWALMKLIIRYARADGIGTIKGEVLKENTGMLAMCEALGFTIATSPDDPAVALVTLPVTELPEGID
ncbi:bifunctional acetate--CoA ligase family protein/GNAT family N-acetyltransferase [Polymorphum gilvum]|uniref:Acetyltransferase, GNAT family n=1 Tax=Polymorphum gilvum (strain LMG 25793 / CGMCC 1.9160 / SL003B-26A1) TaxID=991905 RepID=F2J0X6_POLGS|nr:GNAT family N-acetyltransferase [Polymorphum gilvum]ADZ71922.1 Acetyltransferase, GNAT family [Polymorphum gilvum SL003B-26A1]